VLFPVFSCLCPSGMLSALGALGDSPLLLTAVGSLLTSSFCFSFAIFLSSLLELQTLSRGCRCPSNFLCPPPAAMENFPEHRPVHAVHIPSGGQHPCSHVQPGDGVAVVPGGWLGPARQCCTACRKGAPSARPARSRVPTRTATFTSCLVLMFLSFPLASLGYVMTGKEMLLRSGQGASRSPFPLFSGHWGGGEVLSWCSPESQLWFGCDSSWCPVNLCCAQALLEMVLGSD